MLLKCVSYNPIGSLMKFYGISSLNFLTKEEYASFMYELHDKAVDLIWEHYARLSEEGEADEIVDAWMNYEPYEDED